MSPSRGEVMLTVGTLNWTMAILAGSFFAVPTLAPAIAADLGVEAGIVGLYATIVFAVAMASSLVGGPIAARFGPLRLLAVCMACVTGAMVLAGGGSLFWLLCAAVLLGIGFGPETPASSLVLSRVATGPRRPLIFSIKQTGNQVGGMLGSLSLPALLPLVGWRGGLLMFAGLAVLAIPLLLWLRRRLEPPPVIDSRPSFAVLISSLRLVLQTSALRRLAAASFGVSLAQTCMHTFLVSFAVIDRGFPLATAALLLSACQVGGFVGRIGWGFIAGRYLPTRIVLGLIGLGAAIGTIAIVSLPASLAWLAGPAFLLGLTASGWNGVFLAEVATLAPEGKVAEATGGMLTPSYVGLILGPMIFGGVLWVAGSYGIAFLVSAGICLASMLPLAAPPKRG
ncbi:MFS transporter [Desertibaculum subflavum]|uniref:MFS transporter n=1 Tax=Desertibaculum subflavum TaxID=2268458 RepID=UPI0013C47D34